MKNHFFRWVLASLILGRCFFPNFIEAALLNNDFDLTDLKGVKLGYYIGSFDPIHLGHQHLIEKALQSGHIDYLLIYPVPGGDSFKNRTPLALRQLMIASLYQNHPKVLVTDWTPKELQDKFAPFSKHIEIIGIIGSDVVTETLLGPDKDLSQKYRSIFMQGFPLKEKHYEDTVGAIMALKATSFLIALRGDLDLSYLNGQVADRPIRAFIQSENRSSTEIRTAIHNKKPFENLLCFPVQALIKQEGLYGYTPSLNSNLRTDLLKMQELDQKARSDFTSFNEDGWKQMEEIDKKNGLKLKEIIREYGWPGVSLVGLDGACAIWLLIQHQDHDVDFQKHCLELLKDSVKKYEADRSSLAYLTDRVKMNEGEAQVYGTQWIIKDGKFLLYSVENPEHLNERRLEMGLSTIEEYQRQIQTTYQE